MSFRFLLSFSSGSHRTGARTATLIAAALVAVSLLVLAPSPSVAQPDARGGGAAGQASTPLPSIDEKTAGMAKMDGYLPLYWDSDTGTLYLEINRLNQELLHVNGLGAGLGSNDIGLDRGILAGSRIVEFERVGRKILMVQPNYRFRSSSSNPAEVRAVEDAFARSVLWGFTAIAEDEGRVLVDLTDFLLRDSARIGQRMRPGSYRLDTSRSTVYRPATAVFPENTEIEAELTFVRQPGGQNGGPSGFFGFGGFGSSSFEGVNRVAASGDAATIRLHHSFVQLPDSNYQPRIADPRAGYGGTTYQDYSTPLGEEMTRRFINRHRLTKRDPAAAISEPVEPIVYYLDPGTPEPVRSALLDGARWWDQAYEAAGYRNAFRVEMLPEGVHPLDIRYNVINWVHRSTRGWSTGGSVTDPRTGEIIKGVVTLGSLRIRQDYLIAEGLLSPYESGDETPPELAEWALARIRQLSAHEVGHTLGLSHNYYDSSRGRISVLDYPHPLISLAADGTFDYSSVYDTGIGEWDKVAITYGYREFPPGTPSAQVERELDQLLDQAWNNDIRFLTNQDTAIHPRADQWSNGTDAAAELERMMAVRARALERFGERAIRTGRPLATLEEALVPLYLHHRYQVEAAASVLGGIDYDYVVRGDGRPPAKPVPAALQQSALRALVATLALDALALPRSILDLIPPRPPGYRPHREMFPRYTGSAFDSLSPAVVAADLVTTNLLEPRRAARLVEQSALDPSLPGLDTVIEALFAGTFGADARDGYQAEIKRSVERVVIDRLIGLATNAQMPQVRAMAAHRLAQTAEGLRSGGVSEADRAHRSLLARDIERSLDRPMPESDPMSPLAAPPGAPIGSPAMNWLELTPVCSAANQG